VQFLEPYRRQAWFPKVVEQDAPCSASKFSGLPALAKDETWPCCANCGEPMQLFLQIHSQDLPEQADAAFGQGYLQVFYCTNSEQECEVECEAYFPFAKSTLVRVVDYAQNDLAELVESPVKEAFSEKQIVGWAVKDDFPSWEEQRELGVSLTDQQAETLSESGAPHSGDKLLGWPYWVQGVEYPNCPECGEPMKLIFQIDSEDHLSYMFGDVGCAHVTQCEVHKDQLTIAWACH